MTSAGEPSIVNQGKIIVVTPNIPSTSKTLKVQGTPSNNADDSDLSDPLLRQQEAEVTDNGPLKCSYQMKEKEQSVPIQIIKNANISNIESIRCSLTQITQV